MPREERVVGRYRGLLRPEEADIRESPVTVIDVRPEDEFRQAHIPFARSMPLSELEWRIRELPRGKPVVAYCRGPFCVMSDAAVELLRARGFRVRKITDGVTEWRLAGLPVEGEAEAANQRS